MSTPNDPIETPPPDVPEEFLDAYRRAYEQALSDLDSNHVEGTHDARKTPVVDEPTPVAEAEPQLPSHRRDDAPGESTFAPAPPDAEVARISGPLYANSDRVTEYERTGVADSWARLRRSRVFVPLVLAVIAVVLVGGAFVAGRLLSSKVDKGLTTTDQTSTTPYDGAVDWLRDLKASATCAARPSVDAGGKRVFYGPARAVDGRSETAWRCPGNAPEMTLTVTLDKTTNIGQVGLLPGYAKTDAKSGADRYAENNRVTKVRWTIGSKSYIQDLADNPKDRSVRIERVPPTEAKTIKLTVLAVAKGTRDVTAISEIAVGAVKK